MGMVGTCVIYIGLTALNISAKNMCERVPKRNNSGENIAKMVESDTSVSKSFLYACKL